jgi:CheY-like chemotaxis protein
MRAVVVDDRGAQGEYAHFLKAHHNRLPPLTLDVYTSWRAFTASLAAATPDLILLDMRFDDGPVEHLAGDLDALTRSARFSGDRARAEAQLRGIQGVFILQALRDDRHLRAPVILFGTLPKVQSDRLLERYGPLRILDGLLFEGVREALTWAERLTTPASP